MPSRGSIEHSGAVHCVMALIQPHAGGAKLRASIVQRPLGILAKYSLEKAQPRVVEETCTCCKNLASMLRSSSIGIVVGVKHIEHN